MARRVNGGFSGKLADFVLMHDGRVRSYVKPSNPRTPEQNKRRAWIKEATDEWHARLTNEERARWNAYARPCWPPFSGCNAYVSAGYFARQRGIEPPRDPHQAIDLKLIGQDGLLSSSYRHRRRLHGRRP